VKLFAAPRPALLLVSAVSAVALVASGLVLGGGAASAAPARDPGTADATSWRVNGPRGSALDGVVRLDDDGEVALDVVADGDTVLSATRLGLRGSDGDLTTGLTFVERRERRVSDSYTMTTGKSVRRSYVHTESVFTFADAAGARLGVAVRVSRDGVAYRYLLDGAGEHRVDDESGAWEPASDGPAWMQRSYAVNYEAEWTTTTAKAGNGGGSVGFPVLFQQGDRYALVTEADLHGDYSGAHLTHMAGSLRYDVDLFEGRPVTAAGPLSTPWRVAIVGDRPPSSARTWSTTWPPRAPWTRARTGSGPAGRAGAGSPTGTARGTRSGSGTSSTSPRATAGSTCCWTRAGTRAGCRARCATPTRRASTSSRGSTAATCARRSSATSGCRA
jgi:alpha-glucosidase